MKWEERVGIGKGQASRRQKPEAMFSNGTLRPPWGISTHQLRNPEHILLISGCVAGMTGGGGDRGDEAPRAAPSEVRRIALSFREVPLVSNAMTQASREVLIELLFLSLYLDDHLSLSEDDVLTNALDSLGWESPDSREKFIFSAFAAAREAASCAIKTESFLYSRLEQIKADGQQGPALTWLSRVLGADGISSSEQRFLNQLEARLFP